MDKYLRSSMEGLRKPSSSPQTSLKILELYVPVFRLIEAGWKVDIAAPKRAKLPAKATGTTSSRTSALTRSTQTSTTFSSCLGGKPDGAPTTVRNNSRAVEIARSFFAGNKPVAAICHGPYLLVSADLVKGRRLTSYSGRRRAGGNHQRRREMGRRGRSGRWKPRHLAMADGHSRVLREMMKLVGGEKA